VHHMCRARSLHGPDPRSPMKHMSPERGAIRHVLERSRTVAIVGASPSPERHSHTVARYLSHAGYDVIPVRPDRCDVAGLPRHLAQRSGHPEKWGVHVRRRKQTYEDNRMRPDAGGYVAGGGGGHVAGGGVRSVLDEKKMVKGKPSPRSGPRKPARGLRTRKV